MDMIIFILLIFIFSFVLLVVELFLREMIRQTMTAFLGWVSVQRSRVNVSTLYNPVPAHSGAIDSHWQPRLTAVRSNGLPFCTTPFAHQMVPLAEPPSNSTRVPL